MTRFFTLLTSSDSKDRQLAVELCSELVTEPEEDFITEIASLIGTTDTEATVTILELLVTYEYYLDAETISKVMALVTSGEDSLRLAAYRFLKNTQDSPSATTLLEALEDPIDEIREIATDCLNKEILCDFMSFEVAEYLRHENPTIQNAARELLIASGQEDLLSKVEN